MNLITEKDWSFERIREVCEGRAARLESLGAPESLLSELLKALNEAINRKHIRIGVDSKENAFIECRAIVQFHVAPELYDWFFNGRTGYRAQFWIDPNVGLEFNRRIVEELAEPLGRRLPTTVMVRRIEVTPECGSRDVGAMGITRDKLIRSLAPDDSKIWICEQLFPHEGGTVEPVGLPTLSDAAQSQAKLCIPRWAEAIRPKTGEKGEGLRAPFPPDENSWLDLKGGFLDAEGRTGQIKNQNKRASEIHEYGWT